MKTALIGLGRMGRRHLENVAALGLHLTAVSDVRPEAMEDAAKDWKERTGLEGLELIGDPEALLERVRPECVIVATTAPSHARLTCLAAEAGAQYIVCEKPMAVSIEQCDAMLAACERAGAALAINHPMRFMDRFLAVKELVGSDEFGPLASAVTVGANIGLAMNGTHRFEAFRLLTGQAPDRVTAWFSPERLANPRGPEFEDRAGTVHVTTASGERLHLELSANQGHGLLSVYTCLHGQIVVDDLDGGMSWNRRQTEHRNKPTAQYLNPGDRAARQIQAAEATAPSRALLRAVLERKDYPTGIDGRWAVATLVAAYESAEHCNVPVAVDDHLPKGRLFPWA